MVRGVGEGGARVDLRVATGLLRSIAGVGESSGVDDVKRAIADHSRLSSMLDGEGARLAKLLSRHTARPEEAFAKAARKSGREGRKARRRGETTDGSSGVR